MKSKIRRIIYISYSVEIECEKSYEESEINYALDVLVVDSSSSLKGIGVRERVRVSISR